MIAKYYVYVHRRQSDNAPFYVGKGSGSRAYRVSGRSDYWNKVKDKYGFTVDIVFDSLTEEEAFDLEISTIQEFRYFGYKLVNLTNGGEGCSGKGKPKSKEFVEKMRKSLTGKKQSIETRKKRINTLLKTGTCNDKNIYIFYNEKDIFIGTRKQFCSEYCINRLKIRTLFNKQKSKKVLGWSILTFDQLLILSYLYKEI